MEAGDFKRPTTPFLAAGIVRYELFRVISINGGPFHGYPRRRTTACNIAQERFGLLARRHSYISAPPAQYQPGSGSLEGLNAFVWVCLASTHQRSVTEAISGRLVFARCHLR